MRLTGPPCAAKTSRRPHTCAAAYTRLMSNGLTVRRGNKRGIELRPGSVAQARSEAGLSLAQVANSRVSRAAIHLIETGQSRPTLATLRLIAQRTRKPLAFFTADGQEPKDAEEAGEFAVVELERYGIAGQWVAMRDRAARLLERVQRPAELRSRIALAAARAATILGAGEEALDYATRALESARETMDPIVEVDALAWQSAAMHVAHDPGALEAMRQALARCRQLNPPQPEIEARILTNIALALLGQQRWDDAVDAFDAGLRATEGMRDLARMARMYDGLTVAFEARGNLDLAGAYARRALGLYEMASNRAGEARMRTKFAGLLLRTGNLAGAQEQVSAAFQALHLSGIETGSGNLYAIAAAVAVASGNDTDADRLLASGEEIAKRELDREVLADLKRIQARRAARTADIKGVSRLFDSALQLLPDSSAPALRAEYLTEYASILDELGAADRAAAVWKSAALAQSPMPAGAGTGKGSARASAG